MATSQWCCMPRGGVGGAAQWARTTRAGAGSARAGGASRRGAAKAGVLRGGFPLACIEQVAATGWRVQQARSTKLARVHGPGAGTRGGSRLAGSRRRGPWRRVGGASGCVRGRVAGGAVGARVGAVGASVWAMWRRVIRGRHLPALNGVGHAAAPERACTRCPVFGTRVKPRRFRALVGRGAWARFVRPPDSSARMLGPNPGFLASRAEPINRPLTPSFTRFFGLFHRGPSTGTLFTLLICTW